MVTDDERYKVAARLHNSMPEEWFLTISVWNIIQHACGIDDMDTNREKLDRLADLIEPEPERTCGMVGPINGEYFCCKCGHMNRKTYKSDKGWYRPAYCAHCGTKVVYRD